jgi:hypothetical protein
MIVMLNTVSRLGQHIPGAQNGGVFLKQKFYLGRDRIRNILLSRGRSNRDWFSLRLKLDDFTLGFRTTCADMAGGWEEVVGAGS